MSSGAAKRFSSGSKDRVGALLLLAFCVTYGFLSQDIALLPGHHTMAFHARTLPTFLTVVGLALCLLLLLFPASPQAVNFRQIHWLRLVGFLLLMSLFGFAIRPLGFLLATALFLLSGFLLLAERSYARLILIPIGVAIGFWAIMNLGLGVYVNPLPAFAFD